MFEAFGQQRQICVRVGINESGSDHHPRTIQLLGGPAAQGALDAFDAPVEETDFSQERRPPATVYHPRIPDNGVEFHKSFT
jgi:hypothetical protein